MKKISVEPRHLDYLVKTMLAVEKIRVSTQVRNTHLQKRNQSDETCIELQKMLAEVETFVDKTIAEVIENHPAFPWFSQVKGIGKENIAKVIGLVDISKASYVSSLWKFAGFAVEDGKAPRAQRGKKLEFNRQLRTMCWRLISSLNRAKGSYYEYFLKQKEHYTQRFLQNGFTIIPAEQLPFKMERGKRIRYESDKVISLGHVNNMAKRKMIKLFLAHLWLVWREAEGLPTSKPYVQEYKGHEHIISPWEMTAKEKEKPKTGKRATQSKKPNV